MDLGDSSDKLRQNYRLTQAGTTEQATFTPAHERGQQVDDLDPGLENLGLRREILEIRRFPVNRPILIGRDGPSAVNRLAQQVEHATQRLLTYWYFYGP